jgi:RNA recognition motif-containing protein
MSARLFVGNVPYETTRDELATLLSAAGTIADLHLPTDRETGRPRGFAFVTFSTEAEAADALQRFNDVEVRGQRLSVAAAREHSSRPAEPPRQPPPGRGGERRGTFKRKGSRRGLRARKRSL